MTGCGDLDIAIEAVNKGALSFLTKPFNQEDLVTLVNRGIERHMMVQVEKKYLLTLENTVMRKTRELEDAAMMANEPSHGHKILSGSFHPTLHMASSIALHHHEQWDGDGYPRGLKGKDIPIEARIVKLADEYDTLGNVRSY